MEETVAPIDTSRTAVPAEILSLTELLAYHVHSVWVGQRLRDGWKYGPERNDARKEHPSLVPFAQLSDSEKEYDRLTAMETVKAILALGYRIEKA